VQVGKVCNGLRLAVVYLCLIDLLFKGRIECTAAGNILILECELLQSQWRRGGGTTRDKTECDEDKMYMQSACDCVHTGIRNKFVTVTGGCAVLLLCANSLFMVARGHKKQNSTDGNGNIRNIEYTGAKTADAKVKKVYNLPIINNSIDQVSNSTATYE